jgi:hypothetical protein
MKKCKISKILAYYSHSQNLNQSSQEEIKDDCLYLHMILPTKEKNEEVQAQKKLYYELGCKIFEINKIYK